MNWKAKWIWDKSGKHPRNYWLCFRKTFVIDNHIEDAILNITADSRYTVYLNGQRLGSGPVRSWPQEQSYDSYRIKDYLKRGNNSIAVLVNHYGISDFQYIEGQGGLLAQIDFFENGKTVSSIGTDRSWINKVHLGYNRNSMRIIIMQPWAEIYDAQKFNLDWYKAEFSDSDWENSIEIGRVGTKPWSTLIPSDTPHLTNEKIYPCRVVSLKEVIPNKKNISIDLRHNFC